MSKLKLIIPLVVLLVVAGGVYKLKFAKAAPPPKVAGEVYVLPKEFTINLATGRFAKVDVGLVFEHGYVPEPAKGEGATPPEGYGALTQEALVRGIVTDQLTDAKADELIDRKGREELQKAITKQINKHTDVEVEETVFTDVAVQ